MTRIMVGQRVRDTLSGYEGIAYGITEYLHGCWHIGIKPTKLNKDGQPQDTFWIDEPQVEILPDKKLKRSGSTGGPTTLQALKALESRRL